jgi:hypothetical protein
MIERLVALRCDLCTEHFTGLGSGAWNVRTAAREDGWRYVNGFDMCAKCASDPVMFTRVDGR